MAVKELDAEYQGSPVVFLEYDVDDEAYLSRKMYFWSAYSGGGSLLLPLISVDSGHQISHGSVDYRSIYKQMVDAALTRPAAVDIEAAWWREGDRVVTSVEVTNRSGVTLEAANRARVHAVVFENNQVQLTKHYVRAAVEESIPYDDRLPSGASARYTLATGDLDGVDWAKLDVAIIVDYQPNSASTAYDALQATLATRISGPFAVSNTNLMLLTDGASDRPGAARSQPVQINGASGLTWTATAAAPWLAVTPASGPVNSAAQVAVNPALLAEGWNHSTVTFSAGGQYRQTIAVAAYRGELAFVYLPVMVK